MNCSDNVSSDEVLPEEIISSSRQTGMGYAHIDQILSMMKWESNDLVIIYDPEALFGNLFPDAVIIPPSCECAGGA